MVCGWRGVSGSTLSWRCALEAVWDWETTGRFSAYLIGMLILPGTLTWRVLRVVRTAGSELSRRPLMEDLALGTVLGSAMELPIYLGCRAVGHPQLILAWPILIVALTLLPSARRVWTRQPNAGPAPTWFSISLALLAVYILTYLSIFVWARDSGTQTWALEHPYIDDPFHLALVGDLRHHFPGQIPYVAGTPLHYHWLTCAHLASASWTTGIEPVVLLKSLSLPTIILVTIMAAVAAGVRLSGRWWVGLALIHSIRG